MHNFITKMKLHRELKRLGVSRAELKRMSNKEKWYIKEFYEIKGLFK